MKKTLLVIVFAIIGVVCGAQNKTTKVVTDSLTFMPNQVQIFEGVTKNGNPKWWIELPTETGFKKVSLSESHVKSGRLLALIEKMDTQTGKYYYSVKFAESKKGSGTGKADLSAFKKQ